MTMTQLYKKCPICEGHYVGCIACGGSGFVEHGQAMACENHDILDDIKRQLWVNQSSFCCYRDLHRDSESVSFRDPRTGQRYEIVVRELDGDDQIGRFGKGE